MSSSSPKTFVSNQATALTSPMNLGQSSSTTRLIAPRPFYRSQVTPDPFDYTNHNRQQLMSNVPQRRYSVQQINADDGDNVSISSSSDESLSLEFPPPPQAFLTPPDLGRSASTLRKNPLLPTVVYRSDSGSSLSNSYLSDHEPSASPTLSMQQQYRTGNRALISVSSAQSPLITIASGGSPTRSEIRVSSLPKSNKSTLREIRISRPDSPSISINRSPSNQPISNGSGGAFHISVGAPVGRDSLGNRFTPLITYTNPNIDRSPAIVNLPPAHSPTAVGVRNGHAGKREGSDVDQLTKLLLKSMNSSNEPNFFGMCARCNDEIVGEENGLVAMDRMYHVSCFTCTMCGCRLRGMHFYSMENKPYCEPCYINSLEKCALCSRPITDRILRATGKPYHAQCFCCVACEKSLDGVPFTVDANMQIHCIDCFHQKFAPRCFACHRAILPSPGEEETARIVALDRSYHIDCYRCENCQLQFTTDEGCYPIDEHLFCVQCNLKYARKMLGHT